MYTMNKNVTDLTKNIIGMTIYVILCSGKDKYIFYFDDLTESNSQ